MNYDIMPEILLCLPVQSLMRFRAVCKTWGNLIDSQRFQKLHTRNNDNNKPNDTVYLQLAHSNEQDKVCLQVTFPNVGHRVQKELSVKLQWDRKSLLAYKFDCFNVLSLRLVDAVKGLICINPTKLYSKSTDSWKELGDVIIDGLRFDFVIPIKSACKNGYFVHWYAYVKRVEGDVQKILSFDMKNEVFREITLPEDNTYTYTNIVGSTRRLYSQIFAEDEHLFRHFKFQIRGSDNSVKIYESRCEGSELSWNHVTNVRVPLSGSEEVPLCRTSCVFFMHKSSVFVYDYSARR
ncbi:uncharacterized protein LOC125207479 [Salvia hispanica]|uniref:uncharacterized protein LOC125207479 n=1 Tax=Salvia hispanica TaxID=49212 RepID=UPI002009360A|nr:uncharacterized protein LOC125207479 [Salvia hispanica]